MGGKMSNSGIINNGILGMNQSPVGKNASVTVTTASPQATPVRQPDDQCDIGIITVKAVEAGAVAEELRLVRKDSPGHSFDIGRVSADGRTSRIVATRALEQGQRSTMAAADLLCKHHKPRVIVLAGIAGGIHQDLALGDVVIATRVLYYELRREEPDGTRRRGEVRDTPVATGHAVNRFFTDHGEPAVFRSPDHTDAHPEFRVFGGPIGSGEAVISDRRSAVRAYLTQVNDKVLAVETEAGGLSQHAHEYSAAGDRPYGWVVVRGISDLAADMTDDDQPDAAKHAAIVLRELIPYLPVEDRL